MLNLARMWHVYNEVQLGRWNLVTLLPYFGDILRELEANRKELAELRKPRPCVALSREELIRREREKLQLPLFQEVL